MRKTASLSNDVARYVERESERTGLSESAVIEALLAEAMRQQWRVQTERRVEAG